MQLVVGLGNPGIRYAATPHNLGFLVIDKVAQHLGVVIQRPEADSLLGAAHLAGNEILLAKPQTYMNLSGRAVNKLLTGWGLTARDLLVIVDDLDLPWRQLRIRERGSAGTHNGLRSITEEIDSSDFPRVRLGIAPDHPVEDPATYVLTPFSKQQMESVEEFVGRGAEATLTILEEGIAAAMNRFNRVVTTPATQVE